MDKIAEALADAVKAIVVKQCQTSTCEANTLAKIGEALADSSKTRIIEQCRTNACEGKIDNIAKALADAARNSFMQKREEGCAEPVCSAAEATNLRPERDAVPCASLRKNPDGTWEAIGRVTIKIGSSTVTIANNKIGRNSIKVGDTDVAAFLDQSCDRQ